MIPDRILCLELFGDYAQFRKFFTNMSPLSFSIPPRTTIAGLIGAIIGIDKLENPEFYTRDSSFIALRLINPIKKTKLAMNYLKVTSAKHLFDFEDHKPTNIEFLKDVRYRLYVSFANRELYNRLRDKLKVHQSHYTISLGISGCLANYHYLGEFELRGINPGVIVTVDTVSPSASVASIALNEPLSIQKVVMPSTMSNDRKVTQYDEVLFEKNGKRMPIVFNDTAYKVEVLEDYIHGF